MISTGSEREDRREEARWPLKERTSGEPRSSRENQAPTVVTPKDTSSSRLLLRERRTRRERTKMLRIERMGLLPE
jgi:hypothetical protein